MKPRKAVVKMAPYSPPTGQRFGKTRLDFNENTVGCSPAVAAYLKQAITPERLSVYPDYSDVRKSLAAHFQVKAGEFTLTNGTDEAIQILLNTFIDDGDEVLILRPSYAMYRFYAQVAGAAIKEVDYEAPSFEFPFKQLKAAIRPKTRAILLSSPNNPTGTAISLKEIESVLTLAPKAAVLVDEAYFEFHGVTALPGIEKYRNLFVSRTFSKVYGLAAMRVGCLFSHESNVAFLQKAQSPYSVNMIAALAAQAAVNDTSYVKKYVAEALAARKLLCDGLDALGISFVPSAANFVLADMNTRAVEIRDSLRGHAILVRDRSYEIPGGLRITVGTLAQTRRLLRELKRIW
jgi:histidinol-phosphate aminotransferase